MKDKRNSKEISKSIIKGLKQSLNFSKKKIIKGLKIYKTRGDSQLLSQQNNS